MSLATRVSRLLVGAVSLTACQENISPARGSWSQVAAGDRFSCGLAQDGQAWCWGIGIFGQLGNGVTQTMTSPAKVVGGLSFRSIAVGNNHACGITPGGSAYCWGYGDFGELGVPVGVCNRATAPFITCSAMPVAVGGSRLFDTLVLASYSSCGLEQGGAAWCWGWNDHGQLGTSGTLRASDTMPTAVAGGRRYSLITLDIMHACAIATTGALFCWGSNENGQLAADTLTTPRCGTGAGFYCATSPVASAAGLGVTSVSAGSTHTCALLASGAASCWGSNEYGVLGNPGAPGGIVPVSVAGGRSFTQISAGQDHTCALEPDGAAWCWGLNAWGQLGVPSVTDACPAFGSAQLCAGSPVMVAGAPPLIAVSAGSGHTCGLTAAGEAWCWGRGQEGQLGDGLGMSSAAPVHVSRR